MNKDTITKFNTLIKSRALWYALFFVLAASLHLYCLELSNSDEGLVLAHGYKIANGETIYQDFFAYKSPLSFYAVALLIKIFGANLYVIKLFSVALLLLTLIGIEKISSFYLQRPWSFFPSLLYLLSTQSAPLINHNFFNITLVVWVAYFFLRAIKEKQNLFLSASGFLLGLAWCTLQHRSTVVGIGIFLGLLSLAFSKQSKIKKTGLIYFILSAIGPIMVLYFLMGSEVFWNNLVLYPLQNYSSVNKLPLGPFYFYLFSLLTTGVILTLKKIHKYHALILIQVFLLFSIYARPGAYYMKIISFGTLILFIIFIKHLFQKLSTNNKKIFTITSLSLLTTIFTNLMIFQSGNEYSRQKYQELISYIEDNCSDNLLYSGPFSPNLYFMTKRKNPTSFASLITGLHTKEQFQQAANEIKNNPPKCVVLDYDMVKQFSYNQNNPLDNYINDNYATIKEVEIGHLISIRKYQDGKN